MNRAPRTCHELGVCHGRKGLGCTCQHGTESLPRTSKAQGKPASTSKAQGKPAGGGYYFAPGAIESGPHRRKRLAGWQRLVLDIAACLAVAGLIGFAAGVLQAKGWPL